MRQRIQLYSRRTILSILSGLLAGTASSVFLFSLEWATQTRNEYPILIWGLPFAGLWIGWMYHKYGRDVAPGHNLIIDEISDPKKIVPLRMAPMILISTIITHLFGGSAGREGTAVQMGASLSDQLSHFFKLASAERRILLVAGAGAGFGAAIGAPWAGTIFGMEVLHIGRLKLFAWFECFVASFVGFYTSIFLKAPHTHYLSIPWKDVVGDFSFRTLYFIALAGIIFGLTAKLFSKTVHFLEVVQAKYIPFAPFKPFFAGLLLVLLFYFEASYRYVGLGIPLIQDALHSPNSFRDPILKFLFTTLTVSSGFKGGEFIPLVFIGTTMGSALSAVLPISFHLLAAVGFAAVFAGASNTPIACSIMAIEIFGYQIAPYAVVGCFISYYSSGHQGIYKRQRIASRKLNFKTSNYE